MQPTDHMSIASVYFFEPSSSSGGRYLSESCLQRASGRKPVLPCDCESVSPTVCSAAVDCTPPETFAHCGTVQCTADSQQRLALLWLTLAPVSLYTAEAILSAAVHGNCGHCGSTEPSEGHAVQRRPVAKGQARKAAVSTGDSQCGTPCSCDRAGHASHSACDHSFGTARPCSVQSLCHSRSVTSA